MERERAINLAVKNMRLSKFFGFAAFSVEKLNYVTKPSDLLRFGTCFSVGLACIFLSFKFNSEFITSQSEIVDYGNFVAFIASLIITLIAMIWGFFCRQRVWKIILGFAKLDVQFNAIGYVENYSENAKKVFRKFILVFLLFIPLIVSVYVLDGSLLKAIFFCYAGIYFLLVISSVVGLTSATLMRLKLVTRVLNDIQSAETGINVRHKVITLINIYADMLKIYSTINFCCGFQAMLDVGLLFFQSIFTSFMAFKSYKDHGSLNGRAVSSVLYVSYLQLFTANVLQVCTLAEKETTKILKITRKILQKSEDDVEKALLMFFSSLVKANTPKFTCGLFDFDWKLVYGVS